MTDRIPRKGLESQGIATAAEIFWNLTTAPLVEHAVGAGKGCSPRMAHWSSKPASTPAAARKDEFTVKDEHGRRHLVDQGQ